MARTLNHDFFKTWSPEMAYVLGYFAADGSMVKNTRGGFYIEFTSTDRVILEQVCRVSNSPHKISERPIRNEAWKQQYRIQIGSREWFSDLAVLGFTVRKSKTLALPCIPNLYRGDFVRGYFDGDGCVYFKALKFADRKRLRWILMCTFTSGSRRFLESIWSLLKEEGVLGGSIRIKKRGFDLALSHKDSLALYRFMYNTAQVPDLCLPRKRQKLEQAIQVLGLEKQMRL